MDTSTAAALLQATVVQKMTYKTRLCTVVMVVKLGLESVTP
jgi:hypothetical protein